jgi:hypothetical protein
MVVAQGPRAMFQQLREWLTTMKPKPGKDFSAQRAKWADDARLRREREDEWWKAMTALQAAGRIANAEKLIVENMAEVSRFVLDPEERIATLHAREVDRLLALGDRAGAEAAAREASRWMSIWASHSTSGGEGTARSNAGARMEEELRQKLQSIKTAC